MPVITQRPRAREDLAEIWDYIADDSAARADAFIDTVNGKFRALAGQPEMGHPARYKGEYLARETKCSA